MERLVFCTFLYVIAMGTATAAMAEPYRPSHDTEVLETLPAPGDADQRQLRELRATLAKDPMNRRLAVTVARRYIQAARSEADPRYHGYAHAALAPWWDLAKPPVDVLLLRAVVRQSRHDFDGALADLDRVLAARPRHQQAWLTRAFVLQVQGRHDAAMTSCQRLGPSVDRLVIATCIGRVESLSGKAEAGYERLRRALDASPDAEDRLRVWALTVLAEIAARRGAPAAAEAHFRDALALGLRDPYLLGAYADVLLDQGRADEVVALLKDETRVDALLLRLTIAAQRLGRADAADHAAALRARFAASRKRNDARHLREDARFTLEVLGAPRRALGLAKANWRTQREPADARLVLAAAVAADAAGEARKILDWLARTGLQDAALEPLVQRLKRGEDR